MLGSNVSKVVLGFLATMFVMLAYVTATTLNVTLIFSRLSDEFFAYYNLIKALVSIAFFFLVTPIVDRFGRIKLLYFFLILIIAGVVVGQLFIDTNVAMSVSVMAACEGALLTGFSVFFWGAITEAFSTLEGKKYFPIIASAYGVGGVLGGIFVSKIVQIYGANTLVFVWLGLMVLCVIVCFHLGRSIAVHEAFAPKSESGGEKSKEQPLAVSSNSGNGALPSEIIRFGRTIFLYIFFIWVIRRIVEYRFNLTIRGITSGEDELAQFLGIYTSVVNVAIVLYQLVISRSIIQRYGLAKLLIFFPACLLALAVALLVIHNDATVIFYRGVTDFFFGTVALGAVNLLYTIVPYHSKGKMQTFVEAVGKFGGGVLASLLVYIVAIQQLETQQYMLDGLIFLFSIACAVAAYRVGRRYIDTAILNIDGRDAKLLTNSVQALQERGNAIAIKKLLRIAVNEKGDYQDEMQKTAVRSLSSMRHHAMVDLFLRKFERGSRDWILFSLSMLRQHFTSEVRSNPLLRHKVSKHIERFILGIEGQDYEAAYIHSAATSIYFEIMRQDLLPPFLEQVLKSDDARLIANSIEGISLLNNKYTYLYINKFLNHPNNRVRSTAILEMWNHQEDKEPLLKGLTDMLCKPVKRDKISAIWAIGKIRHEEALDVLFRNRNKIDLHDSDFNLHLAYALLRFPNRFLLRKRGLKLDYIEDLYRIVLSAATDPNHPGLAKRASHYIKRFHNSNFQGLTSRLCEFTQEGVDLFYEVLANETDVPVRLMMLVQRYSSSVSVDVTQNRLL